MALCCRSDKDLVNQERSFAMFRDDSKSGSRSRGVGNINVFQHATTETFDLWPVGVFHNKLKHVSNFVSFGILLTFTKVSQIQYNWLCKLIYENYT